jgi:hypothetical protein
MIVDSSFQSFGFSIPKTVVSLIERCIEISERDDYAARPSLFGYDAPGLIFAPYLLNTVRLFQGDKTLISDTGRYSSTPFELFPVLCFGGDGIHWGPVVHAPELGLEDYPWAEHNPSQLMGRQFCCFASNSPQAIEQVLSDNLARIALPDCDELKDQWDEAEFITEISGFLSLNPSVLKARDLSALDCHPVIPWVPVGWNFVMTSDSVGVLAPIDSFCPNAPDSFDSRSIDECLERVQHYLNQDYPATALGFIREFYWKTQPNLEEISDSWIEIYTRLNRPVLAQEIERELEKRRAWQASYSPAPEDDTLSAELSQEMEIVSDFEFD